MNENTITTFQITPDNKLSLNVSKERLNTLKSDIIIQMCIDLYKKTELGRLNRAAKAFINEDYIAKDLIILHDFEVEGKKEPAARGVLIKKELSNNINTPREIGSKDKIYPCQITSSSDQNRGTYGTCTCPDFSNRHMTCKHGVYLSYVILNNIEEELGNCFAWAHLEKKLVEL